MPYQRVSTSVKQTIIDASRRDDDYVEAAKLLGVKRTTAYGIVRRWKEKGVVEQQRGGFRLQRVKVDDEMREMAVRIVEEHPAFTSKQITQELRVRLPDKPAISISSLANLLDGQLIKMKKLEDFPQERNRPDVKEERQEYARWLTTEGVNNNIIYLDECGFNLFLHKADER